MGRCVEVRPKIAVLSASRYFWKIAEKLYRSIPAERIDRLENINFILLLPQREMLLELQSSSFPLKVLD